jgi:hypothetical protein
MGMWFNPNSRGSRLRIWQPWGCNSLHAHHFAATGLSGNSRPRRLKIAAPSGCKSRVADRRVVNREQQTASTQDRIALGVQVSPRRPIWNVNRTSEPGFGANECVLLLEDVAQAHGIPPISAHVPKTEVSLMASKLTRRDQHAVCSFHGLPVGPLSPTTTPVPLCKPRARHDLNSPGPHERTASVCGRGRRFSQFFVPVSGSPLIVILPLAKSQSEPRTRAASLFLAPL